MTTFWSVWVIVLTVITFVATTWLLYANRKTTPKNEDGTTGHTFDGIQEYDNPLPAWWFHMFNITIIFGVAYLIAYPGLGNWPGLLGWTQFNQLEKQVQTAEARYRPMRDKFLAQPVTEIAHDPMIRKMGQRMFANNCAQCHGSDAGGAYGFPNLTDNDWIFGGSPESIKQTITQGRQTAMPAWGAVIGDEGVANVTAYLLSINGREAEANSIAAGKTVFNTYCAACHQADGSGNPALGAPNLANGIWLYGGSSAEIAHSIRAGRNGIMPAMGDVLAEDKIHILTAWVYGLSN
jgi:cytochrome c oxidase cbb3-type subunit 3